MTVLLDRGDLGPSWVVEGGVLRRASAVERERASAPQRGAETALTRLDCAWDPRVEIAPGAVNAHTHLYSGLAPLGLPAPARAPANFVQILERVWWRLDRALDERSLRASARYALATGLLAGTTTVIDHQESPEFVDGSLDVLADAAEELGVRLVVTYGATERNQGRDEARRGLVECARFVRANHRPLVRGLVGLHASFTVGDETVREAGALARELGVPMHVHVAEDAADVLDARARGWAGPFERLRDLGALPRGSVLAHGVHLTREQVRAAEELGSWFVQNPRSNEGNHVEYPRALAASRHVALGTDGWPADMRVERAALERLGRAHGDSEAALSARARSGYELASALTGARLGPELADGFAADVSVGLPDAPPRHVLVAGRVIVRDGRLDTADFDALRAEAHSQAARLWTRMSALPEPA